MPVYIEKVEIWSGDTNPSQIDRQTTKYSATQHSACLKYKVKAESRNILQKCLVYIGVSKFVEVGLDLGIVRRFWEAHLTS